MKTFLTVTNICPHCKEQVEVDVLSHEKVLIECPACNILMEVENGEFNESTYKPKSLRVSDIHEILDRYEESLRLNDPLTELLILGDCEKIISWYKESERSKELEDWKAATERHKDGDILKSLEINKIRFNMSNQLYNIFTNHIKKYLS